MQGVGETGKEYINAFDLRTLDFAWRDLQIGLNKGWGGVMSTATGLVAYGDDAQNFVILNGYTGKPLWHFNVGRWKDAGFLLRKQSRSKRAAPITQRVCRAWVRPVKRT